MADRMSERAANISEFTAIEDESKLFLKHGGMVGKHDTYPPLP